MVEIGSTTQISERVRTNDDGWVTLIDVTPEELRASRIPDYCILGIWVEFTSPAGNKYTAVHVYSHPKTKSYILLSSPDKDRPDFIAVEKSVTKKAMGIRGRCIDDRVSDICDVISLIRRPTQKRVADLVDGYREEFADTRVSAAYYKNVPSSIRAELASS